MRLNGAKFVQDRVVEFEISFKLYRQISLKVLTKVGINFVFFAATKVNEMKPRTNLSPKKPFFLPTTQTDGIFDKILNTA